MVVIQVSRVMQKLSRFYTKLLFVAFALVGGALPFEAQAEFDMYPGYVIVEREVSAAGGGVSLDSRLRAKGARQVRSLGNRLHLVDRNVAAANGVERAMRRVNQSDLQFCEKLVKDRLAAYCEPNYAYRISAVPNDPKYSELWGMNQSNDIDIDAPEAWGLSTGSSDVVVAVIDTGIDYNHPDLSQNVWVNPGEIAGNKIDDDGNGYVDDVHGINTINGKGNPMDDNSHGTHVSGTIGGRGNNGVGVVGVNWNVKIIGVKFLDSSGSGSLADAVEGINYVTWLKNHGVNVVLTNNSWGGGGFSQSLKNAIEAANAAGIMFVAAAGNEANDNDADPSYPASYDVANVVSVGAVDQQGNLAYFSNYGASSVDIAAPGVDIVSTVPGNSYASYSGTSMATPHVSGALALLKAYSPSLDMPALIARLYDSGEELASLDGVIRTRRLLNLYRMLSNLTAPVPSPTPIPAAYDYNVNAIPYAPYSMEGASRVVQADESSFYSVDLPFSFNYFGNLVSKLIISPNGVVYTKSAPGGFDYQNGSSASSNSMAVLHTDLFGSGGAHGVWLKVSADKVLIEWYAPHYLYKNSPALRLQLAVHSSGTLETFYDLGSSQVLSFVGGSSTIGLAGTGPNQVETYAYNNHSIPNLGGLSWVPVGGEPEAQLRLSGLKKKVKAGSRQVGVSGSAGGSGYLQLRYGNNVCSLGDVELGDSGARSVLLYLKRVSTNMSMTLVARASNGQVQDTFGFKLLGSGNAPKSKLSKKSLFNKICDSARTRSQGLVN